MLNKEKTVIYLRVSTKEQEEDGYSLEVQENTSLKYAKNNNLEIVKLWKCSESAWGKIERKVFNKMIELVKTRRDIRHIIFYSPDRMTRNIKDNETIKELREQYGKVIHFCQTGEKEEGKLTSSNEMMSDIRTSFNKFFSNFISEKTAPAMRQKASNGIYPSNPPIGYINNKLNKTIEIDVSRAQLIKELFFKVADGNHSMHTLSDYLFKQGLRSKNYNKKVGISTLYKIIKNPFYYGEFYWSGILYKGTHDPLITKDLWKKANEVLTGNRKPYIIGQRFAFSRLLTCEKCGCNILGEIHKGKYIYYRCSFSRGSHSHKKALTQEILIAKLKDIIPKIYLSGKIHRWLSRVIKEINIKQNLLIENKITILKNNLTADKLKLNNLYEKEFDDIKTSEDKKIFYKEKEKSLLESIETSKKELTKCCLEKDNIIKEFKHIFKISKYYNLADNFEKANIIKLILNKSILSKDNEIIPNYKTPFDIFANINK
jgi:DNA invertase Pin-like site-specific DNA recombinase